MPAPSILPASPAAIRVGGAALLLATLLFVGVFTFLAGRFDYPAVLDQPAAQVLPALLALGPAGRAVWWLYGLVPLLLLPVGLGVQATGRLPGVAPVPMAARMALLAAVLAAVAMAIGLLRWPSLHWQLAQAHAVASPAGREAIAAVFDGANALLGQVLGEFLGELFLNLFFVCAALVVGAAGGAGWRWLRRAGLAAAGLGTMAMLRHAVPGLEAVAALNNLVLPVWMLLLGGALWRLGSAGTWRAVGASAAA